MATLVLQAADRLIGGVANAAIGLAGDAVGGLFGGSSAAPAARVVEGPRLSEMNGLASTEGAPIPRLYGRARLGGQCIWATRFEEAATTSVERSPARGGKGFGSSSKGKATVTTTYAYFANLAVGLCEGPIALVRRVWADGREIDLTAITMRVHRGTEDQPPDPLIVAKEGTEAAPAYRGLAYVVFERLPLGPFGNRVPQFSFEVVRSVDGLPQMIRSVCLIPGATEFGYELAPVTRDLGLGASAPENIHQLQRPTDVSASLDALQALCPNLQGVSLVVSWFGDDLRAGHCTVAPRVDLGGKSTRGAEWAVAGLTRALAREVTRAGETAAYGGTPSDASVVGLIRNLKARGLRVTLYPFVMMDVPAGNDLPDPRTGGAGQPAYPWRGRITCDPAPGRLGSPDGTAEAAEQVSAFFGASDPNGWSFRRLVLHYAQLAVEAGGVDAFIIGSELVGLTRVRSGPGLYPAVDALRALASEVRTVLGPGTRLTYAADWTEYGAHVLEGGAEVRFPLDPLWADPAIDAVGIDYYPPISDWRDGLSGADRAEARSSHDVGYLRRRLGSGEAFDWYYPDNAARSAGRRSPITDGAHGKPWVFRSKDLLGWWSNPHRERVGGVESGATAWTPASKPVWLTEIGIPAVDKGPNGPNVFPDPKSAESALPPLSRGTRDDLVQARGLEAILSRFDPALPGFEPAFNPVSAATGIRMVDPARTAVWAWDARPYPAFPDFDRVWADGGNWQTGHWITGRIEGVPLDRLLAAVLAEYGLGPIALPPLDGFLDGYVIDRPMSAREVLEPLQALFGFDVATKAGGLAFRGRGGTVDLRVARDDLVDAEGTPLLARTRAQETELPASVRFGFTDGAGEYGRAAVASRRLAGGSRRETSAEFAVVTRREDAQRLADIALQDAWSGRETAEFHLSPQRIEVEPGDVLSLEDESGEMLHRVLRIEDGQTRRISTRAVEPAMFETPARTIAAKPRRSPPSVTGAPAVEILELAVARGTPPALQYLAVAADPWPGGVAVWRAADGGSFSLHAIAELPALIGRLRGACGPGPVWRWDRRTVLEIDLSGGAVTSVPDEAALAGGNLFALQGENGAWEILSAARADLVGPRRYRLSRLLRGLAGTEHLAARTVAAGATIVRLDEALVPLTSSLADLGRSWTYRVGPADRDHADPSYVEIAATVGSEALRPLPPVHVRACREPGGVRISWTRQTRIDGDAWEVLDPPLGEEWERYELDILADGAVRRTLATGEPSVFYPASLEIADFGAPRATLTLVVAQMSASIGRGQARVTVVPVR
jgi:hypothetical protein